MHNLIPFGKYFLSCLERLYFPRTLRCLAAYTYKKEGECQTSSFPIWLWPSIIQNLYLQSHLYLLQVEPSVLTLRECSLNETYSFTLTPTIPIHNGLLGNGLTIGLWLPADISVDNDECQITLEGLTSKTVRLFSHCNNVPGSGSEKLISLKVEHSHSEFWNTVPYLPAIRVSQVRCY